MLEIGQVLEGKYKILSIIGKGGMSTVYLAINEKVNKTWAVKEVRKDKHENFELIHESLLMETEMLKKLNNPNLPSIVDIIDYEDDFYVVMDYVDGKTLEEILKQKNKLSQNEVADIALQLASVLSYLHSQTPPIIYRDMKPSNVMLQADGKVVLIDFGTAREYKDRKNEDTTCLGTRGYAAPEQFGGMGQTDARTDIYALGVTMYFLITGKNPTKPPYEIYPIRHWDASLSSGMEHIISKCTNINPDERYQDVKELIYDLENYHNYDQSALKLYKQRLTFFLFTAVASIIMGFTGIMGLSISEKMQRHSYETMINSAKKSTDEKQTLEYLMNAISLYPDKSEAYFMVCDCFCEDGVFSMEEETQLLKLANADNKSLELWKNKEENDYAEFCFSIGNAYWFYYEHEENRQTYAMNWYEEAKEIYTTKDDYQIKATRCELYSKIGSFYKKIVTAQIEGEDQGMYKEYWEELEKLKQENDKNPDRDLITLRMYNEMVSNSIEYASYLKEDGITQNEILDMHKEIQEKMKKLNSKSGKIQKEIFKIEELITEGEVIIQSTYEEI